MSTFDYELPTTGAIAFGDFLYDPTGAHAVHLSQATSSRAALRSTLKESKRMGGEKDYLRVIKVVEDYLRYLSGVLACVRSGDLVKRSEPIFSWRATLSSHTFKSSRIEAAGLHYELSFTLLTYAYALSDLARATVSALGPYEQQQYASEAERKEKDEQLNFAAKLLCKAGGVYKHISDVVLPEWDQSTAASGRPVDVSPEIVNALSKVALADAHCLAIRKLLSRTTSETVMQLGSALPKSHPSPMLLAKLYVHTHDEYRSARSLIQTQASKPSEGSPNEVDSDLRKYLANQSALVLALVYKWLGVDAGEHERTGEAVAFLQAAKEELGNIKDVKEGKAFLPDVKGKKKGRSSEELDAVLQFLTKYTTTNDTITFQPVPAVSAVRSMVPNGRSALEIKTFSESEPAFRPSSAEGVTVPRRNEQTARSEDAQGVVNSTAEQESQGGISQDNYAGAGRYF